MAEGKGYAVIVKLNLPPEKQFHAGHSLILQGDTVPGVANLIEDLAGGSVQAFDIIGRFIEYAQQGLVVQGLAVPEAPQGVMPPVPPVPQLVGTDGAKASQSLVTFASNKLGVDAKELVDKTESEIKQLLKGGVK